LKRGESIFPSPAFKGGKGVVGKKNLGVKYGIMKKRVSWKSVSLELLRQSKRAGGKGEGFPKRS